MEIVLRAAKYAIASYNKYQPRRARKYLHESQTKKIKNIPALIEKRDQ